MKKILIVDDDPVAGLAFRHSLERQDFIICLATDGAQGVERLATFRPDAVLLDFMLPGAVDGVAVLSRLRADPAFCDLPVVVMTNACVPAFVEQALEAGADHVVDKSNVTPLAVAELIYWLLSRRAEKDITISE